MNPRLLLLIPILAGIPVTTFIHFTITPLDRQSTLTSTLEIRRGQSPTEITKELVALQTITDGRKFFLLGRLARHWNKIKAGEYRVSPAQSPLELFSILTSGMSISHPITIHEGEALNEVIDDLASKKLGDPDLLRGLCQSPEFIQSLGYFENDPPTTLEGYILPETYFFNRTMTSQEIIKQMVKHFFAIWGEAEKNRAHSLNLSRHEIITLASIIEKETGAPVERSLISSVFHNRLKKGMKLQSDPTTIYGMGARYKGKLRRSDLYQSNPYNTYTIPGLPPGPISNPGKESIQAALYPAESPYLFFVSHNNGTHEFTSSLKEHNRAVQKFQIDPKARQGKSWRDLRRKMASTPTPNGPR